MVKRERSVHTYTTMWWASEWFLNKGLQEPKGSKYEFMASLVFSAYTLEAYLNHIGRKLFGCWNDIERRLGPREKLNLLAERLKVEIKQGELPWQTMKALFDFRNDIAHGKSEDLEESNTLPLNEYDEERFQGFIQTRWEKYCIKDNAIRARQGVKNIVEILHAECRFEDNPHPFVSGMQLGSTTVLPD